MVGRQSYEYEANSPALNANYKTEADVVVPVINQFHLYEKIMVELSWSVTAKVGGYGDQTYGWGTESYGLFDLQQSVYTTRQSNNLDSESYSMRMHRATMHLSTELYRGSEALFWTWFSTTNSAAISDITYLAFSE